MRKGLEEGKRGYVKGPELGGGGGGGGAKLERENYNEGEIRSWRGNEEVAAEGEN